MIRIRLGARYAGELEKYVDRYDAISLLDKGEMSGVILELSGELTLSNLEVFLDQVKLLISNQLYERIVEEVRRWIAG
jgi:hypothetical protein